MNPRRDTPAMNDEGSPLCVILDELGYVFLERLQDALGGLDIKVPKQRAALTDDHMIVLAIGRENAELLCDVLGGETFYVPRGRLSSHLVAVESEQRAGTRNTAIARKLGISERHVRRLKQQLANLTGHLGHAIATA